MHNHAHADGGRAVSRCKEELLSLSRVLFEPSGPTSVDGGPVGWIQSALRHTHTQWRWWHQRWQTYTNRNHGDTRWVLMKASLFISWLLFVMSSFMLITARPQYIMWQPGVSRQVMYGEPTLTDCFVGSRLWSSCNVLDLRGTRFCGYLATFHLGGFFSPHCATTGRCYRTQETSRLSKGHASWFLGCFSQLEQL